MQGEEDVDVTVLIKLHVPKKRARSDLSVLESLSDVLNLLTTP